MHKLSVDEGIAAFSTIFSKQLTKSPIKHYIRWLKDWPEDFWIEKTDDEYILCYNLQALRDVTKDEGMLHLTIERDGRRLQPIHFKLWQSSHGGNCKKIKFTRNVKPRNDFFGHAEKVDGVEPVSKKSKVRVSDGSNDIYNEARKALNTAVDNMYLFPILGELELLDSLTTQNLAPPAKLL